MAISNDLLQYEDCRRAMDAALADPRGVKVERDSRGMAVNFRQRCYRFRRLCKTLAMQSQSEDDPDYGFSPYDILVATVEGPFCVIRKREHEDLRIVSLGEDE